MEFTCDIFSKLDKQWALLTAGNEEKFNSMTVSWGGMGTIWGKPVVTVYVRPNRYTYEFTEAGEDFTLSFYGEEYKKALGVMGSKSGRDIDKVKETGLTPVKAGASMSYAEAETTLVLKKLYAQDMDATQIPKDAWDKFFTNDPVHRMYICEVVDMISK